MNATAERAVRVIERTLSSGRLARTHEVAVEIAGELARAGLLTRRSCVAAERVRLVCDGEEFDEARYVYRDDVSSWVLIRWGGRRDGPPERTLRARLLDGTVADGRLVFEAIGGD